MRIDKIPVFDLIILYFTVGILFGTFTKFTKIPTFYPSVILIVLYTLVYRSKVFFTKTMGLIFILYIVLLVYDIVSHLHDIPKVHISPFGIFSLVFPYFISALIIENLIAYKYKSPLILSNVGKIAFILIIITSLLTVVSESLIPGATRNVSKVGLPFWVTTHTFGSIYALPFVIAVFVASYRKNLLSFSLILLLFIINMLEAGFLTAVFFTVILAFVGLMIRFKVKKPFYYLSTIVLLLVIVMLNFDFVIALLPTLPNIAYSNKIYELTQLNESSDISGLAGVRGNVYRVSLSSFFENIWFGSGTWKSLGEHSYWLDRFGFIGIFGTSFFFVLLYNLYKRALLLVPESEKLTYQYIILFWGIMLIFNPFYQMDFWIIMFVFIPLIMNYFKGDENLNKT